MRIRAKETTDTTEVIVVLFCNAKGTTGGRKRERERLQARHLKKKNLLEKHEFAKSILVFFWLSQKNFLLCYSATPFFTCLCLFEGGNCTWAIFEGSFTAIPSAWWSTQPFESHGTRNVLSLSTLSILKDSPLPSLFLLYFVLAHLCSFLAPRSCSVDSKEKCQRGSLSGSSEMRLSEGSIKTGLFYYEACRTLLVSLEEEKNK